MTNVFMRLAKDDPDNAQMYYHLASHESLFAMAARARKSGQELLFALFDEWLAQDVQDSITRNRIMAAHDCEDGASLILEPSAFRLHILPKIVANVISYDEIFAIFHHIEQSLGGNAAIIGDRTAFYDRHYLPAYREAVCRYGASRGDSSVVLEQLADYRRMKSMRRYRLDDMLPSKAS